MALQVAEYLLLFCLHSSWLISTCISKDMRKDLSVPYSSAQRVGEQVTGVDSEGVTVKCKAVEGEHRVPGRTVVWVRSASETG